MCARSVGLEPFTGSGQGQNNDQQERDCIFTCKLLCCKCSFCHRVATKERRKSQLLSKLHGNKICKRCFLCRSLEFCKSCHKCPNCCYNSTCRVKVTSLLGEVGSSGFESKGSHNTQKGLHLPVQTKSNQVTNCHKQLCQSTETVKLLEALYQLMNKNAVEPVANQNSLGFYNRPFLVPKANNRWRPILDLSTLNTFLNTESFKMETPETIRTSLQLGEWVTSIDFKDAYFHIPIHSQSRKYMRFHIQGQSYQFKALPFGLSTAPGVHSDGQRGQTDGFTVRYKNQPVPRRLVGESHIPPNLSPAYTDLGSSLSRTRLAGEQGEVRTGPKTGFQLRRLTVRSQGGQGQTDTRALEELNRQDTVNPPVRCARSGSSCPS